MTLDPDEKELLESYERGEWKPVGEDEVVRLRELARQHLRADVGVGFDSLARAEGRLHKRVSEQLAQLKSRGRARRLKKR